MITKKDKFYKCVAEEEVPEIFEELLTQNDGSLKVKVFGPAKEVLDQTTKSLRDYFYSKPSYNDVVNALILINQNLPLETLADAVDNLNRRKPRTPVSPVTT